LIATAACAGGLAATAGTASASVPTKQTISTPQSMTANPGSKISFSGTSTYKAGGDRPVAGDKVDLQWRTNGDWHDADHATTDAKGHVSLSGTARDNSHWRLVHEGTALNGTSNSRDTVVHTAKPIGQRVVDKAAAQKGKPYAYGATGPNSFDCSGLTQYVYKQVGVKLPRTSQAQSDAVKHVSNSSKKPGDLLFFGGSNVYHVAIYAGGNKMWTAPDSGDVVKLQKIYTSDYSVGRAS
jgi:cell wall-associated NlpC family hydrolase